MNSKKTLIVLVVALVAVIALASIAYGALGNRVQNEKGSTATSQASSSTAADTQADAGQSAAAGQNGTSGAQGAASNQAQPDMQTYDFTVENIKGESVKLSSMQGKPTVVGFWATWCPPCQAEAPAVQELYERYGDRVNFMMIDATDGQRETAEMAKEWIDQGGYTYPVYLDTNNMMASYTFQVANLPTTVVFDAQGNVFDYFVGAMTTEDMSQLFEDLL